MFVPVVPFGVAGILFAPVFVGLGVALAAYARELVLHDTRWDLVGMPGRRVGEPARWHVLLQQLVGVGVAMDGLVLTNGVQVVV